MSDQNCVVTRRRVLIPVVIAPLLAAAGTQAAEFVRSQDPEVAAVRKVIEDIIAADNARDLEKVLTLYNDDAVLMTPSGPDIVGSNAIRTHYEQLFTHAVFDIESRIDEIVVSDGWAIARGVNEVVSIPRGNENRTRVSSKYLMSLHRDSTGGWRIAHLMWSNQAIPPVENEI